MTMRLKEWIEEKRFLKGRWTLSPSHELFFDSDGKKGEEVRLKGTIVSVGPGEIILSVTDIQADQNPKTHLLKLGGRWQANAKNQLQFEVEKESGKKDILTFKNGWQINKNQEILYSYTEEQLKRKKKITRELIFKGFWALENGNRLIYLIGGDDRSAFRFRGSFQTPSVYAKDGQLRYQAGIELNGRHKIQQISLFGKWKVSRDFALSFEMDCRGKKRLLHFGGQWRLIGQNQMAARLISQGGRPVGAEIIFTRDFAKKDGQAFLNLRKLSEETAVEAGVSFKW